MVVACRSYQIGSPCPFSSGFTKLSKSRLKTELVVTFCKFRMPAKMPGACVQERTSSLKIFLNSAALSPISPCFVAPTWERTGLQQEGLTDQAGFAFVVTLFGHFFHHMCGFYRKPLKAFAAGFQGIQLVDPCHTMSPAHNTSPVS